MSSPPAPEVTSPPVKKHKKHKSEKRERDDKEALGLKLILKAKEVRNECKWIPVTLILGYQNLITKSPKRKRRKRTRIRTEKKSTNIIIRNGKGIVNLDIYQQIGSPNREQRQCVIKKLQERTFLSKGLDHLLTQLEKKDPQNFFAWPVTDNIAPGYSQIITSPMDFSTMRQKIEDNEYKHLDEFIADFKLMCENAMKYNHAETVYYKASKKLLQAGLKMMTPDKLGWMLNLVPEITSEEVGFEITAEMRATKQQDDLEDSDHGVEHKKKMPPTKFEAVPDELTPEEILAKSQMAARHAKAKLIGGDGVIPGTRKRPVLLGQLCGKVTDGTSQLQGFREDRRNVAKPVKPLYYGAFGSYAPSYDSAFANLSKEESDLVYSTYGSDTAVQYAESMQDFAKDSDYATHLVDSLLDLLTGGDHSRTKKVLEDNKNLREEEVAVKTMLEVKPIDSVKVNVDELKSLQDLGIDVNFLDNMEEEIRVSEERHELQQRLDSMCELLKKLQQTQYQRLSAPLPPQLNNCPPPSEEETHLAENITENLTEIAKRVTPSEVAPVAGIRKALGISMPEVNAPPAPEVPNIDLESELRQFLEGEPSLAPSPLRDDKTIEEILMDHLNNCPPPSEEETHLAENITENLTEIAKLVTPSEVAPVAGIRKALGISMPEVNAPPAPEVPNIDLESELMQFLESEPSLAPSPLRDDKTIEEILMDHLNNCSPPSEEETHSAENITENLTEIAKLVTPSEVAPVAGIRKALGISMPEVNAPPAPEVPNIDLESELRQFLESEPSLAPSPLRDDKTIEEILMDHLNNCPPPSEEETHSAENITENLTEIAKLVTPSEVAPVAGIRKALGISMPEVNAPPAPEVPNIDLESELRQFLESEPSLAPSPLRDDKTIEEILMDHLNNCPPPSEEETHLAENITENLTEIAKLVTPSEVAPVPGIRKALGINIPEVNAPPAPEVPNIDLESELRQFLEGEPSLAPSPLRDDKTIKEILLAFFQFLMVAKQELFLH
nr:unnamed protein product [Callosobruchus analis]